MVSELVFPRQASALAESEWHRTLKGSEDSFSKKLEQMMREFKESFQKSLRNPFNKAWEDDDEFLEDATLGETMIPATGEKNQINDDMTNISSKTHALQVYDQMPPVTCTWDSRYLTPQFLQERRSKGLCDFCDHPYTAEHHLSHKKLRLQVVEMEEADEDDHEKQGCILKMPTQVFEEEKLADFGKTDHSLEYPVSEMTNMINSIESEASVGGSKVDLLDEFFSKDGSFLTTTGRDQSSQILVGPALHRIDSAAATPDVEEPSLQFKWWYMLRPIQWHYAEGLLLPSPIIEWFLGQLQERTSAEALELLLPVLVDVIENLAVSQTYVRTFVDVATRSINDLSSGDSCLLENSEKTPLISALAELMRYLILAMPDTFVSLDCFPLPLWVVPDANFQNTVLKAPESLDCANFDTRDKYLRHLSFGYFISSLQKCASTLRKIVKPSLQGHGVAKVVQALDRTMIAGDVRFAYNCLFEDLCDAATGERWIGDVSPCLRSSLKWIDVLNKHLQQLVNSYPVPLFMRGRPEQPKCDFGRKVVDILQQENIQFGSFDILSDDEVSQMLKVYSNWSSYPQLYIKGELIGGSDRTLEMQKTGELKKLDSFERRVCKEIGTEINEPLMAPDPYNYWTSLDTQGEHKDSLSHHMQLDVDSIGTFLGGLKLKSIKWCCMFGEHEVSAEVLGTSVIRCQAPPHIPGKVPFYITCGNSDTGTRKQLSCKGKIDTAGPNAIIEYTDTTMEIRIKALASQTDTLRVNNHVHVLALKEQVTTVSEVLAEQQRFICRWRILKDDEMIVRIGVLCKTPVNDQSKVFDRGRCIKLARKFRSVRPRDGFSRVWEEPAAAWTNLKSIKVALRGANNLKLTSVLDCEGEGHNLSQAHFFDSLRDSLHLILEDKYDLKGEGLIGIKVGGVHRGRYPYSVDGPLVGYSQLEPGR